MKSTEDWIRQLPGDEFLAALPGDTPDDARMKVQVRKNCTGCHSASYPLQHRYSDIKTGKSGEFKPRPPQRGDQSTRGVRATSLVRNQNRIAWPSMVSRRIRRGSSRGKSLRAWIDAQLSQITRSPSFHLCS